MAQDSLSFDFKYGVHRVYPGFSVTYIELEAAESLLDLNEYYPAADVKTYESVDIVTMQDGVELSSRGSDDNLTKDQKAKILSADYGTIIKVQVHYLPDNTLSHNELKEMAFEFVMEPHEPAGYAGGHTQLLSFLSENGLRELAADNFRKHHLTGVNFTVDDSGHISDVHMAESSECSKTDMILIEAICKLPQWTPAQYEDGTRVAQSYVLTIGDHNSCVINLLKIRARTDSLDQLDLQKIN